ncbi:hypothetical protein BDFG_06731 [Blastomyces dermatitidis ATCC 26199]|nr:hypothetical protein BDFG_06731 [Blastomyces dermatitidis ATCC 26199]
MQNNITTQLFRNQTIKTKAKGKSIRCYALRVHATHPHYASYAYFPSCLRNPQNAHFFLLYIVSFSPILAS